MCPNCREQGEVGTPCSEKGCGKRGYHHVPAEMLRDGDVECPHGCAAGLCRTVDPPPEPSPAGDITHLAKVTVSSTHKPYKGYTYGAHHLFDGDLTTSWQPDDADRCGAGEWILVTFPKAVEVVAIQYANGMQVAVSDEGDRFHNNCRVKTLELESEGGTTMLTARDAKGLETWTLKTPLRTS